MITTRSLLSSLIGTGIVCLFLGGVAEATVPRAFVSINGSDLNPCSAVQPCRSFNQALTVVQAGGEIVVQDSGGYSTGFTITQGVTIDAAGFNASVISISNTDLCTINAGASDRVVLRGISFHGAGVGQNAINVTQVGSLYVEHCSIAEFTGNGVDMESGGNLFVTGADVRKCAKGVVVDSTGISANLIAHNSRFTECDNGVFIGALGSADVTGMLSECTASLCSSAGFGAGSISSGNSDLTLTHCRAERSTTGILASTFSTGNTTIRIASCVVTQNSTGIFTGKIGSGTPAVIGTSPGGNVIDGNTTNGSTTSSTTMQ
jgi:hypothetical protein